MYRKMIMVTKSVIVYCTTVSNNNGFVEVLNNFWWGYLRHLVLFIKLWNCISSDVVSHLLPSLYGSLNQPLKTQSYHYILFRTIDDNSFLALDFFWVHVCFICKHHESHISAFPECENGVFMSFKYLWEILLIGWLDFLIL